MAREKTDIELEEAAVALDEQQHQAGSLEVLARAEINQQIATARAYPRSIKEFVDEATRLVTLNEDVAQSCIYALPRAGKTIEGPSARFAEMVAYSFRNLHYGARPMAEDDEHITSQGVCIDLERNNRSSIEVRRRITDKNGGRFNSDMINVTANAANSIALRNAVLKVVPKALWNPIYQKARKVVLGDYETFQNRLARMFEQFQLLGATKDMVLAKLNKKGPQDVKIEDLVVLGGMITSLKEEGTTIEELFSDVLNKQVAQPRERTDEQARREPMKEPQPKQQEVFSEARDQETQTREEAKPKGKPKKDEKQPSASLLTKNMINQIKLRCESYNVDMGELLGHFEVNKLDDIEQQRMTEVMQYIEKRAERQPGED